MNDEEREHLRTVLGEMDEATNELKVAVMILIYTLALKFNAVDDLLLVARTVAERSPESEAIRKAAALFSDLLSPIRPR